MASPQTMRVKCAEHQLGYIIINVSDFDAAQHEAYDESDAALVSAAAGSTDATEAGSAGEGETDSTSAADATAPKATKQRGKQK